MGLMLSVAFVFVSLVKVSWRVLVSNLDESS